MFSGLRSLAERSKQHAAPMRRSSGFDLCLTHRKDGGTAFQVIASPLQIVVCVSNASHQSFVPSPLYGSTVRIACDLPQQLLAALSPLQRSVESALFQIKHALIIGCIVQIQARLGAGFPI